MRLMDEKAPKPMLNKTFSHGAHMGSHRNAYLRKTNNMQLYKIDGSKLMN